MTLLLQLFAHAFYDGILETVGKGVEFIAIARERLELDNAVKEGIVDVIYVVRAQAAVDAVG